MPKLILTEKITVAKDAPSTPPPTKSEGFSDADLFGFLVIGVIVVLLVGALSQ